MDFLISTVLAIILLYFISSTSAYKSMYKKIKEEKEIIEEELTKLEVLIQRYEKQVKIGTSSLKNNQENLQVARDDLQTLRLENITLKNKINNSAHYCLTRRLNINPNGKYIYTSRDKP